MSSARDGRPGGGDAATALAALVLPRSDDLWGDGWALVEDGDAAGGPSSRAAPWVPESFPTDAQVAEAEVTYVRGDDALVHALALVFPDRTVAARAWGAVADEAFARRFADAVAADADLPDHVVLLGPVMGEQTFTLDRRGGRTTTRRATFSQAEIDRLLPVVLDLAVVVAGPAVVLAWSVAAPAEELEAGWRRFVDRLELRAEAGLGAG